MLRDLKRYVKFYSIYDDAPNSKWASKTFQNRLKKSNIKYQKMSNPLTLELAKILGENPPPIGVNLVLFDGEDMGIRGENETFCQGSRYFAKIICDTSYYGWLINYAQISKIITEKENVDYDEMWKFSDEIHKILKNRPKMFPGFIGGHCVIPNLELINDNSLNQISTINDIFKKFNDSKSS